MRCYNGLTGRYVVQLADGALDIFYKRPVEYEMRGSKWSRGLEK